MERTWDGQTGTWLWAYPDFAKMEEPCRKHGIMKTVKSGESEMKLLRLKDLIELYAEYLRKNPDTFLS
ncbi:hypothetical protein KEJ32_02085 [Candidatus Bathyarchaeota archaeon]|nr:hypothetical protein [Candidatus Bathyarchaeota archaeon]